MPVGICVYACIRINTSAAQHARNPYLLAYLTCWKSWELYVIRIYARVCKLDISGNQEQAAAVLHR